MPVLNTIKDAARHTYWNCALAALIDPVYAEELTIQHEVSYPGPVTETVMDLKNNLVGRDLAALMNGIYLGAIDPEPAFVACRANVVSVVSAGAVTLYLDKSHGSLNTLQDALLQPTNRQ